MDHTTLHDFIQRLAQYQHNDAVADQVLHDLRAWRSAFAVDLQQQMQSAAGFEEHSALQQLHTALNQAVDVQMHSWDAQWAELAPAQSLAEAFDDKVMLLVFGKFNAGKSSLCNLLADTFRLAQQTVQYFYLENAQVVYSLQPLREGATETTARLQGVCLGDKLVLLDTPGLHSVTAENAALTQRFIDSADGVLWLSSSSSPGQVQELDALGRELRRHKPLLPIITRSDQIEEDELDGEICSLLCNKNPAQRALQQDDVYQRSLDKLRDMAVDPQLLSRPVSISAQMARQAEFSPQAMTEAGIDQLFHALLVLIQPALEYKQRKPAEIYLHYLQEQIVDPMQQLMDQMLGQLRQVSAEMHSSLAALPEKMIANIWRSVVPELASLLEQHAATQDVNLVCETVQLWADEALSQQCIAHLADYHLPVIQALELNMAEHYRYEVIAADIETDQPIIAYDRLHAELSSQLQLSLQQQVTPIITACKADLEDVEAKLAQRAEMLLQAMQRLDQIAAQMRLAA